MIKKGKATIPPSTKCGLVDMYMACRLKSMANVTLEFDMSSYCLIGFSGRIKWVLHRSPRAIDIET